MRKLIYTLPFLLLPSIVWANECKEPLVCTLKASEVCKKQDLKLFGKDECVECGCPEGGENKGTETDPICCDQYSNLYNIVSKGYSKTDYNPEKCGCPKDKAGNQGTAITKDDKTTCCFNNHDWNPYEQKYSWEKLQVCGCPSEWKRQINGKELCCRNEVSECPPEKGVPIVLDEATAYCGCGCRTDDDCNTDHNWLNEFFFGKKRRRICSLSPDWQCIKNLTCYQFDNLTIELDGGEGDELQPKDLPALAAKLKSKMELDSDEHVKLVINSYSCSKIGSTVVGYSRQGDSTTIFIDIKHCCEISDGEWTCEGTIVHENEHRQDNYKQPVWYKDLKSKIAQAFANNLTEINAHAKGDINDLIQSYRSCFPESNNFQNVCDDFWAIWPSDKYFLCQKCKTLVPDYLKDFNNSKYAKKYRDDPDYFDPDGGCKGRSYNTCQCRGIRLEVERKYVNSDFARNVYITAQAFRVAACGSAAEEATREDLRNVIEALAECKDWEKPPREDLTDLPMLLAQLYKEKNELCMPAAEIAQNANIAKGLEGLQTCSVIHDFLQANANANLNNLPTTCEDKCEEVTLTSD